MDWDKLRVFHAVAEAGSFTHAGDTLSLSQSAVSRQISALEEALQVPLFHRHARGLILTEQGDLLYLHIGQRQAAADSEQTPEGHVLCFDAAGKIIGLTIINAKWLPCATAS